MSSQSAGARPEGIHALLRRRYSTREFLDRPVSSDSLRRLFDAARWAPSCFNEQPWRFLIGARHDNREAFDAIAGTLVSGNRWALEAPVLGIAIANLAFARNGKPNRWAQYDTGQAMAHLTFQAQMEGLSVHQMGGFDEAKAQQALAIPDGHDPIAAFALGYPVEPDPPDGKRRERESILFTGRFGEPWSA
jgi:nitroreductase